MVNLEKDSSCCCLKLAGTIFTSLHYKPVLPSCFLQLALFALRNVLLKKRNIQLVLSQYTTQDTSQQRACHI
jgi:hypothetical protein